MKYKVTIIKASNFFKLVDFDNDVKQLAFQFTKRFIRVDLGRPSSDGKPPMTVFAASTKERNEFRFHINAFDDWIKFIEDHHIKPPLYKLVDRTKFKAKEVDLPMKKGWVPRDYQEPIIEFLASTDKDAQTRFVGIQTGGGKGMCSISALSKLGKRAMILVKPMYIEKWVEELQEKLDIPVQSIMVIKGGTHLKTFLELCNDKTLDDNRIAIISNKTYQNWLKLYETYGKDIIDLGYPAVPEDLFEVYEGGVRLIDEVHQDFHLWFKTDLYTHVDKCISMSATLDNYDPVTKKMYEIAYPHKSRYEGTVFKPYIDTFAVSYYLQEDRRYQTTEYGQNNYSHNAYEKSILRNNEFFYNYAKMIQSVLDIGFIKRRKEGQKAIVFCSSVRMCTKITEYLQACYHDLDIRRYCDDDPYENLQEPDIRVSTVLSSGTAHDIKNLVCTVLSIAMDSLQANLQTFGRLRPIDGEKLEFYYLNCQDIQKHKNYHKNKATLLKPRSSSFTEIQYPRRV